MTNAAIPITRRALLGSSIAAMAVPSLPLPTSAQEITMAPTEPFWPNDARLAVSFSLMFEAGGQPISGAGGVISDPIEKGLPDLPTNAFFQYGVYEGVPHILNLMDKHQVKLSSFMIGQAVEKAPDLAREIVNRGHEAAAHGRTWQNSYFQVHRRQRRDDPEGDRPAADRLERLLDAQLAAHTRHPAEPRFQVPHRRAEHGRAVHRQAQGRRLRHGPLHLPHERYRLFSVRELQPGRLRAALKDEFDQLYEEGAHRRRMMVISLHDRISGHANRVRVLDRFLAYAKSKPSVWFARKDEIAKWTLEHRTTTPVYDRGAPTVSGLPGSAA
jgi:peptidoglycan/xylan/chitin deacetylase (PgdA/CDA1 family)